MFVTLSVQSIGCIIEASSLPIYFPQIREPEPSHQCVLEDENAGDFFTGTVQIETWWAGRDSNPGPSPYNGGRILRTFFSFHKTFSVFVGGWANCPELL